MICLSIILSHPVFQLQPPAGGVHSHALGACTLSVYIVCVGHVVGIALLCWLVGCTVVGFVHSEVHGALLTLCVAACRLSVSTFGSDTEWGCVVVPSTFTLQPLLGFVAMLLHV